MKKTFDIESLINSVFTIKKEPQSNTEKQQDKSVSNFVKVGTALVTSAALLTGTIALGNVIVKNNSNIISTQTPEAGNISLIPYAGTNYYTCDAEYALTTARQTLDKVEKILTSSDGVTPVGTASGNFYPYYFDEYFLAGIAYVETSFRICDESGKPVESKDGALGLMQIMPQTVKDVNSWLKTTMKVDVQYTVQDLADPVKSMEIATFSLIQTCKNHGKQYCNNPLYPHLNENFSVSRQQEIILAIYNNGYQNMLKYVDNGTVFDYLSEGSSENFVNRVLTESKKLRQNFPQYERQE